MSKINVLSFEIANLIAAGEVVERPSSVLKELIENSIDSGATEIVAEIKRGGVALIRVSDNGCGISRDDLPIAIKRHATSKISTKDDLSSIMTLGFRGEALAAISSVCQMTIITKTAVSECGSMLTSEAGQITDVSEVGSADGTTVVVSNLFYNVPARRKFLKKDATEAMNVCALVEKVALSRPDISIQLLVDGEEKFRTPGNGVLLDTVYAVFGKDFSSKLIEANGTANGIRCHGFIGRSDNVRKNRNQINVFINGRYIKSMTAQAAIEKAYTSYIAPECFPVCVLFLEMNPGTVDVNVHPAKLECKFSDERVVFETVYYTVKDALERSAYRPSMELKNKNGWNNVRGAFVAVDDKAKVTQLSYDTKIPPVIVESDLRQNREKIEQRNESISNREGHSYNPILDRPIKVSSPPPSFTQPRETMSARSSIELLKKYNEQSPQESIPRPFVVEKDLQAKTPNKETEDLPRAEYKYVGELFDCYVVIEYQGEVLIIDKHAAHERVIFEDLKKQRQSDQRVASQFLLLPLCVSLSGEELQCARDICDDLSSVGFEFSIEGENLCITAIPDAISSFDAETLFVNIVDDYIRDKTDPRITDAIRREKALYQIACKAAIKGSRHYDRAVIDWLIGKLLALPDITVCPHGRPVAYKLTKNELDRQFDRLK